MEPRHVTLIRLYRKTTRTWLTIKLGGSWNSEQIMRWTLKRYPTFCFFKAKIVKLRAK